MSDRSFNVRIGSTLSDTFEQEQGVPQGSILSPTLFNIKINNIVKCVNDTDSSLYVDDFGIFYKLKNMENIEFRLRRAPCHPGGRNRWLLCACSRWVRPPLYNATVRYTVPSNI